MTPEQYRERYNLKPDYPMVARNYSESRRAMAHKIGLGARGRNPKQAAAAPSPDAPAKTTAPKARRAPRKKAAATE
jgi:hypothetical protein